jgi:hypothetical protein
MFSNIRNIASINEAIASRVMNQWCFSTMNIIAVGALLLFTAPVSAVGQTISASLPQEVNTSEKYVFYLHGGIVQEQGAHAVSPAFGAYKYHDILDTLRSYGYNIISEVRPKGTDEAVYAKMVSLQVDSLIRQGVAPEHITLVGASLGAYITMESAYRVKNPHINFAIIGLCGEYALDYFSGRESQLYGNFLSIYESSDSKGSCSDLFVNQPHITGFREVKLNMGNGHGFLYRPYPEWVDPLVSLIGEAGKQD